MMIRLKRLWADERGANLVEFALALPVLILMIYGIFSIGLLFQANAGIQHALGEAARYATIFPTPTNAQIQARITDKTFGLKGGTLQTPVIDDTQLANGYKTITMTYTRPTKFLFFNGPTVTITKSKRVYLSS